jgi:hypothetical protein
MCRKEESHAEHGEEVADESALLALSGIDRGDKSQAKLLRDDRAGDLERGNGEPGDEPEHPADENLLDEHDQRRPQRTGIDVVGATMKRQQDGGENERHGEAQARGNVLLAQPRQQHQHRAGAGEHEQKGGGDRREE